ncbi:MAG TPA: protoporphyrinogen oxidase [Candidatus Dormibacteraeota bacterium]|nr:protoporphyrinogen oxidase [Candidatus Dormibacteraeota bacterium]
MTVIVAGGGITGLVAARDLGRAAVPTLLLEASPRLGGKIGTERVDGFVVERGPDSFITTRPAGVTLARELGLGDQLIGVREPRTVYILRDGRLVPMPEGLGLVLPTRAWPFVRTPLFSWPDKARMGLDLVLPRLLGAGDEAVGAFLRRRLGRALVDRLAGPLVGGIYGTDIDELSLDAVVPQLREAESRHRSLLLAGLADGRAMRRARAEREAATRRVGGDASGSGQASAPSRPLGIFPSLAAGMGSLVDALVTSLEADPAVTVRRGVALRTLEPLGAGMVARLSDGSTVRADGIVLATPGPAAATLIEPFAPRAALAVASIPHGSSTVVSLAYRRDRLERELIGHGVLAPRSEGLPISACTWSSEKWPGRAPDDAVLVRAFLPELGPGRSDAQLVELARSAAEPLIQARGEPEIVLVSRAEASMPRYTVGHLERVARAEAELAAVPAVVLAGAAYRGVGLPDCIAQGRAAAARTIERVSGVEAVALA